MTDVSTADTAPYRGAGGRANGFGIVIVTIVLTVVGTNVTVGAFLWLALNARMNQFEARMTSLETGMSQLGTELKADIRELRDEARALNVRLGRMEGALGIVGPAAPGAAAQ